MTIPSTPTGDDLPALGAFGVWQSQRDLDESFAIAVDESGYGTLWIGGAPGDLALVERMLAATRRIVVATGIVNIWTSDPVAVADAWRRVTDAYPGRFVLGVGTGHPEHNGAAAAKPFDALVQYLDALDGAGVPRSARVLAALGPRVLRLSAERSRGAHPYLVTPEHTRAARELVGPGVLLAPEQRVVLRSDPAEARSIGRPTVEKPYLGLVNYRNNLTRLGYTDDDLAGGGSDRLIDDLVVYGDDEAIASRLNEHLAAGADHVSVHILPGPGEDPRPGLARIATALGLG
jgi:probable F420-dependent oxidoreductase